MESKRTATTYFIPPGKFLLMENALGNPDLIQSSVSADCRVTIVDKDNFPLDELEQWPTFRLTAADIRLNLGASSYYIYIVVPTADNAGSSAAFISYHTSLVDRDGYEVVQSLGPDGSPVSSQGSLLGKAGFKYYRCGTVSARGGNASATTTPSGQGRLIEVDLGVTPAPSTLPGHLNDFDKIFQIDKADPSNPNSWLLTILVTIRSLVARVVRITDRLIFGSGESEKPVTGVAVASDKENLEVVNDTTLATTAWVSEKFSGISDDKYLRKDQDDSTPFSLSVGGGLDVSGGLSVEGDATFAENLTAEKSIILGGKQVDGITRYGDNDKPERASDAEIYSALMTEKAIEEKVDALESKYIRKDQDDETPHSLSVGGVLNVGEKLEVGGDALIDGSASVEGGLSVVGELSADGNALIGGDLSVVGGASFDSDLSVKGDASLTGKLDFRGKEIASFIRYYDENKPMSSDVAIYSSLMTDERIEEEIGKIDDVYIRKDKEDVAHKHITFEEGITVHGLAKTMNLEVEELATISRAVVDTLSSSKFVDGFAGEGYQIWKDIASGDWSMTLDRLTVRKVLAIYELIIQKLRSVGGSIVVSAANGKVKSVERVGIEYKFTFEDTNTFAQNDLMRCQVFSPSGMKYYWVEVTHVDGESVYARVSDFQGVTPASGDECVLMGNTKNKLRQNLLLISATEDGQPRFDCYDGVKSRSFEGCLRTRVGNLNGITDSRFPSDMQPKGYGLYADNCFLTGVFVLSNGKDVQTQFAILEGMVRTEISSVRSEINAQDNYLTNASFSSNLESWFYENEVRVFNTSGGLLHFNGDFYSIKENFAGVVAKDSKNVLRIKNSFITQKNADYNLHPSFDKAIDGDLYLPRMFYVSFKYMCVSGGTLRVYFKDELNNGSFEAYTPIVVEEFIGENLSFSPIEYSGKWNGTGDFMLSFDGDIYIYDLALSDNALADVEEKFNMRFEATDKKIQTNIDAIAKNGDALEEYHAEFVETAKGMEASFNKKLTNQYNQITNEYLSEIEITAESLTSSYEAYVDDVESDITRAYKSAIKQTAESITAELSASIDNMADGLQEDYNAKIEASAESLTSDYEAVISDLKTGTIKDMQSQITQNANLIATKVSESDFDALGRRVSSAETSIAQNANAIKLKASQTSLDSLGERVSDAEASLEIQAEEIEARVTKTTYNTLANRVTKAETAITQNANAIELKASQTELDSLGRTVESNSASITTQAGQISSLVTKTNNLGTQYSEVKQTADGLTATVQGLDGDISTLEQTANRLSTRISGAEGDISSLEQTSTSISTKVTTAQGDISTLKQTAKSLETSISNLNGDVSSLEQTASGISATVSNLQGDVSRVEQTASGLSVKVNALDGKYSSLEVEVDALKSAIGDGEISMEDFSEALKGITDKVTANTNAASKAQTAADKALGQTESNLTLIEQNAKDIKLVAGKIVTDSSGKITNISTSGLVLDSEFATMFSTQVSSQGVAKTAQLSAYVKEDDLGDLVSQIEISADQIDLTGKVTFSSFSSSLQSTINAKATKTEVTTLQSSLGSLAYKNSIAANSTFITGLGSLAYDSVVEKAKLGTTIIDGGYIKTELINTGALKISGANVTGLGALAKLDKISATSTYITGLGSLATKNSLNYSDIGLSSWVVEKSVQAAMEGETIMVNGLIQTDLIDVDSLVTKRILTESDSSGYDISIENGYMKITNGSYTPLQVNSSNYGASIFIKDRSGNSAIMTHYGFYHNHSSGKAVNITGGGIALSQGSFIKGFALGNIGTSISYDSDFVVLSSNGSLPSPSANKGKVIFVKFSGNRTLSGSIVPRNSTSSGSVTHSNLSAFYISNGSYWYEFLSVD